MRRAGIALDWIPFNSEYPIAEIVFWISGVRFRSEKTFGVDKVTSLTAMATSCTSSCFSVSTNGLSVFSDFSDLAFGDFGPFAGFFCVFFFPTGDLATVVGSGFLESLSATFLFLVDRS